MSGAGWEIRVGDCRELLRDMESNSVQLCVTSPPYFQLRRYLPSDSPLSHLEMGSEDTPQAFVAHLVDVFREVRRVLHPAGLLAVNLGDSYAGSGKGPTGHNGLGDQAERQGFVNQRAGGTVPAKSLNLIPERFALAMLEDGWIVRSRLAGVKIAPMPESVQDRPTSAWEHVYLFSKQGRYFWDQEAVRSTPTSDHTQQYETKVYRDGDYHRNGIGSVSLGLSAAAGANLRNWFYWPPANFAGAHFATFPPSVPELFIKAATSQAGQCAACGAPWVRVVEREPGFQARRQYDDGMRGRRTGAALDSDYRGVGITRSTTTGWSPSCACQTDQPPVPQLVLDPFAGSGTSILVANRLGRRGLGLELNPDYAQMARDRIQQDAPLIHEIAAAAPPLGRQGRLW